MELALAALAIVGWAFTIWQFIRYVKGRDERERELWDRIQAPERVAARPILDKQNGSVTFVGEIPDNVSDESTTP